MALLQDKKYKKTYEAAEFFRDNCLLRAGSLLFGSERTLWRSDLLEQLRKAFVDNPDLSEQSFIAKFKGQIQPSGDEVCLLAGELLSVYFLFPSNVGGDKKRENVRTVLSWGNASFPDESVISQAFNAGIGSGGSRYNTNRPFELAFFIKFALKWKELPDEQKQQIAFDPWRFQEFIDSVEDADSKQLRHMLLHLLFPENFERITSGGHKRRIIAAFADLLGNGVPDNDEQCILAIRQALEKLLPKKELDFYWEPLAATWYDNSDGSAADGAPLELIQYKKQIVLYGPPGTGKTFRAKQLAGRIIRSAALAKLKPAGYFQSEEKIRQAIINNTHRLQLHPSYSYEDFIRGMHITESGATEYRLGYLPKLVAEIEQENKDQRLPHVLILDEMNRTDLSRMLGESFSLLEDREQTIELPGRDGEGKSLKLKIPEDLFVIGTMNLIDQSIEQIDFALRRRFLWLPCPFNAGALVAAAQDQWNKLDSSLKWEQLEADFRRLAQVAEMLNREIHDSPLLGEQYEIGHTYFLDVVPFLRDFLGVNPTRKQIYLWNNKGEATEPVIKVWRFSLRPLLEQYLSGLDATSCNRELERLEKVLLKPEVL